MLLGTLRQPFRYIIVLLVSLPINAEIILEEIVVTAQKREQSMQDIGITMTAISGKVIEDMGLVHSNEIAATTPNLSIMNPTGDGGTPAVVIRGVGLSDFGVTNQPPIGIYLDEVASGNANAQVSTLLDLERVEILKGPQGTLYGRNTTGGALNLISRKPTKESQASIKLSLAEYGTQKIDAFVSGPLVDNLQGRFAFTNYHADGWQKNTELDSYIEKNYFAARGMLAWQPTTDTNLLLILHSARNDSDSDLYHSTSDPDFFKNGSEYKPKINVETSGVSIKIEKGISELLTFTSITAYDDLDKLHEEDADMQVADIIVTRFEADTHTFSQELRINGDSDNLNWIAGIFYGRDVINAYTYLNLLSKAGEWAYDIKQDVRTTAAFGQLEIDLSEAFTLTLGLRTTHDTVDFENRAGFSDQGIGLSPGMDSLSDGSFTYFADFNGVFGSVNSKVDTTGLYSDDISNTEHSGKIALNWNVTETAMLYTSISRGYKTGAYPGNFIFNPVALQDYDKEVLYAYELGLKSEHLDNRLRLNAAVFWYDYKDAQVFNNSDDQIIGLPVNRVVNLDINIWGIDFDMAWQINDTLNINLAAGITKSEYSENLNDTLTGAVAIKGNQLQNTPEVSSSLLVHYQYPIELGIFYSQFTASYLDDTFYTSNEDRNVRQKAYSLINARLGWQSPGDHWEISIWGKNLADKQYATYIYDLQSFLGENQLMRGAPRTIGIDIKYSY